MANIIFKQQEEFKNATKEEEKPKVEEEKKS